MAPPPVLPPDQRTLSGEDAIEDLPDLTDAKEQVDEDGGVLLKLEPGTEVERDPEFYQNLVSVLPEDELGKVGRDLTELIEDDKEARKKLDSFYAEGIQRTGIAEPAPGGASFQGATKVTHPVLMEAAVDYEARVIKEIFPSNGPVKTKILGKITPEKEDKAKRKAMYMNWQLTTQIPNARADLEQALIQEPIGGTAFTKWGWDDVKKAPTLMCVTMDEVHLPASASSYHQARRVTHELTISEAEYKEKLLTGMYERPDSQPPPSLVPDKTKSASTADKAQGLEPSPDNKDGLRPLYESYVWLALSCDNEGDEAEWRQYPYICTVDPDDERVIGLYRNWVEGDNSYTEIEWLNFWGMIPWRGPYAVGFTHLLGGLAGAATGAMRALLDAAHKANSQSAFKLDGAASGQTIAVDQTGIVSIKGTNTEDDIRKVVMTNPFPGPSQVLFMMLEYAAKEAKGVVQMSFDTMPSANANTPVGTMLAQIEQGLSPFSAIFARQHWSMGRFLQTLHTINRLYLDEGEVVDDTGEIMVKRTDFEGPLDVVPVSDPHIFSEMQRAAQVQVVVQRADLKPPLYNPRKVEELLLKTLKIPNWEDLLVPEPKPDRLNAVNENMASLAGRPISAFPEQEHLAHLQTHLDFLASPFFGGLRITSGIVTPILLNHVKEHLGFWYVSRVSAMLEELIPQDELNEAMKSFDEGETQKLDIAIAVASARVIQQESPEVLQSIPPIIERAFQVLQSFQPPPPMDPRAQAQQAETQRKTAKDQQDNVISQQELQLRREEVQLQAQLANTQSQLDQVRVQLQSQGQQQQHQQKGAELQLRGLVDLAKLRGSMEQKREELAFARDQARSGVTMGMLEIGQAEEQAEQARMSEIERLAAEDERHHLTLAAQARQHAESEATRRRDADLRARTSLASDETKERINQADNETAVQLSLFESLTDEKTALSNGRGVNPNPRPS